MTTKLTIPGIKLDDDRTEQDVNARHAVVTMLATMPTFLPEEDDPEGPSQRSLLFSIEVIG